MAMLIRIGHCLLKPNNYASSLRLWNVNRIDSLKKSAQILKRYITTTNSDLFPMLVRNLCSGVGIEVRGEQVKSVTPGTTLEFLNSLNENHISAYTIEQTTSVLNSIRTTHYRQMYEEIPWLQASIQKAYIQLCLQNILSEKCAEVNGHKTFQTLWNSHADKCDELPPSQVADCLLFGLHLGVELDSNVVHKLLLKLHKLVAKSDSQTLMTTSLIVKALPGTDFILMQQVLNRFCEIMNTCSSMSLSEDEHYAMLHTACNTRRYISSETKTKLSYWLLDYFKENKTIVKHFQAFMRLGEYFQHDKQFFNSFKDIINSSCRLIMDETTPASLAKICSSIRNCHLYLHFDPEITEIVECRVLQLLDRNLKLCDVSNLFSAVNRSTAPNIVWLVCSLLHSNLSKAQDIDYLTFLNIIEVLVCMNVKRINSDLISLIQHWISLRADIFFKLNSYTDILKLLVKRGFVNPKDEARFIDVLLKNLDVLRVGRNRFSIPLVTRFLLQSKAFENSVSGGLPNEIVHCLMDALPNFRITELARIIVYVKLAEAFHDPQLRQQVSQIVRSAQVHLINKLNNEQSLQYQLNLMSGEIDLMKQQTSSFSDKPLPLHPYLGDRNIFLLTKAIQIFQSGIYHLPNLYDQLADYLIQKNSIIEDVWKLRIFRLFATTGHIPKNLSSLMDIAVDLHERINSRKKFNSALQLLVYLSKIQIYLNDILSKLFTVKEIKDLEKNLECLSKGKPAIAEEIEKNMMALNRSVVLECPHLDVPWFHEDYCLTNIASVHTAEETIADDAEALFTLCMVYNAYAAEALNKKADKLKPFRDEVEQAAAEILGGSQYMRCSVHSPYYHMIDIECALTPGRMPVRPSDFFNAEKSKSKFQRIAVCILPEDHYCCNSKHLIGRELERKRHLEILEYKYVEVPHFDWYSTEFSDWKTKVEYLRAKLINF